MSDILYDMYIINAAKGVNRKLLEKEGVVPETYILTRHNIDSTQFANSNNYYAYDTDIYKSIVEKVKTKLEADKKKYEEMSSKIKPVEIKTVYNEKAEVDKFCDGDSCKI